MTSPYNYIAIEGNIGAGKTTLSRKLSELLDYRLVLEQFTDNPFLPLFYQNPERYAFQVELFFMTERYKQLQELYASSDLFQQQTVADYFFLKTLLFAKKNLMEEEYRLFQHLFHTLNARFPDPDLLLYLHRPISILDQFIKKRGRSMEADLTTDYLQKVQQAYFGFFKNKPDFPVLVLDLKDGDFVEEVALLKKIAALLQEEFSAGVHFVEI